MYKLMKLTILSLTFGFVFCETTSVNELTEEQKRELGQEAVFKMAQEIFSKSMEAKRVFVANQNLREDPIDNFATTAPRSSFIVNADISNELAAGAQSAMVYVSTDGQSTWASGDASLLGTEGYENTWEGTINTNDGSTAYSYLSGIVDSEALGESYGTIIVSGSPHNENGQWPPSSSLYANFADEPSGDSSTGSDQDITALQGTYKGSPAFDENGDEYTDIERIYLKLSMQNNCCEEGGLFGPWYLYGIGIVNPSSESAVAYAIGYGDGGFGELSPGILKLTGDLATGEIDGFDYISTNFEYSTSGNDLQVSALMSELTNDPEWGVWPNDYNGFILLGVSVEASLDGLDVAVDISDQTNPGLMICTTTQQTGNELLELSNGTFDSETNTMTVDYIDADGNLPWWRKGQICYPNGGNCFLNIEMVPNGHIYDEGVTYSASFTSDEVANGDYDAKFWFADDDIDSYPQYQLSIPITVGGSGCDVLGDSNGDGVLNILDVVILVNIILAAGDAECADINGDGTLNILDVVLLVNVILAG